MQGLQDSARVRGVQWLRRMKELLQSPDSWTKNAMARNARGQGCSATGPEASCWCLLGALVVVEEDDAGPGNITARDTAWSAIQHAIHARKDESCLDVTRIIDWNDDPRVTHSDVLDVLDTAAANLERGVEPTT